MYRNHWQTELAGRLFENRSEGRSESADGVQPFDGYMVSVPRFGAVIPNNVVTSGELLALIEGYVAKLWTVGQLDGLCYGIWQDNGKTYLDMSERYNDREVALAVAEARGEIAIYDVEGQQEIRV